MISDAAVLHALRSHAVWYHATLFGSGIGNYVGMHFGTRAAALARLRDVLNLPRASRPWGMPDGPGEPTLYEAEIQPQRQLLISDGLHDEEHLVEELLAQGIINELQAGAVQVGEFGLEDCLRTEGIDALVYWNAHEDKGSLSIVPLHNKVIRLIAVHPLIIESDRDFQY